MDGNAPGYGLVVVLGPILLLAVILFAVIRNRRSGRRGVERTEAATRDLYASQDAADKARDGQVHR